jgi:hypothetical protein
MTDETGSNPEKTPDCFRFFSTQIIINYLTVIDHIEAPQVRSSEYTFLMYKSEDVAV